MSENQTENNRPKSIKAYDAYAVRNDKEGNGHFHKVGAAFAHKDGKGFDMDMVAAPTNGRLTLRTPQERLDTQRNGESGKASGTNRERE